METPSYGQKVAWRARNTLKQGFRAFSWVRRAGPPRGAPSFRWGRGPSPPWGGLGSDARRASPFFQRGYPFSSRFSLPPAGKKQVFQTIISQFLCAPSRAARALLVVVGACYSAATHKVASAGGAWVLCFGAGNPVKPLLKSVLGLV